MNDKDKRDLECRGPDITQGVGCKDCYMVWALRLPHPSVLKKAFKSRGWLQRGEMRGTFLTF